MNKLLIALFVLINFNSKAMQPAVYLRTCHNNTANDIVVSFSDDTGNKTLVIPTQQKDSYLIDRKLSALQSINNAGHMSVIGIEKLTSGQDDKYKQMSVMLVFALSEQERVFTSLVLPPVQLSEKARTFLDLVETPAPLGINFDAVIEDEETAFTATIRS